MIIWSYSLLNYYSESYWFIFNTFFITRMHPTWSALLFFKCHCIQFDDILLRICESYWSVIFLCVTSMSGPYRVMGPGTGVKSSFFLFEFWSGRCLLILWDFKKWTFVLIFFIVWFLCVCVFHVIDFCSYFITSILLFRA